MPRSLQVEASLLLQLPPPTVVHPHLIQDRHQIRVIQLRIHISTQTDPSNPVVVLPSRSKEPETLVSVLSQQALLPPRAPEQHHHHLQHQHDGGDLVQKLTS